MPREGWLPAKDPAGRDRTHAALLPMFFGTVGMDDTPLDHAAQATFDAGHMGCGDLVMVLRLRLKALPGQVVRVIALDSGAPEDIPAWCRMTGNELVRHDPDTHSYWIRSRSDWT